MNHVTSVGLDVHARSITAASFNPLTGEVRTVGFSYPFDGLAEWIMSLERPKAIYESGVTGFHLCRELREQGVDCVVCATSKIQRPPADARRKNDANDAVFLARLLSMHNVTEVYVPDRECEAARDLVRAHADCRAELVRAKQRLNHFLMRQGLVFDERNGRGERKKNWTRDYWSWVRGIDFEQEEDSDTFAFYVSEVRHAEATKKQLENFIRRSARKDRWRGRVEALRCLKGVELLTAFALVVEADLFSRFPSASSFAAWTGLVPSEHSSGERTCNGPITGSGNRLVRRLLVEAAWHYSRASPDRKSGTDPEVPLRLENHAAKGTRRLVERRAVMAKRKRPAVANCITARELACWVWSIGCMAEGTM